MYVYKRYDPDLIALLDSGYDLAAMTHMALTHYANKRSVHFYIKELVCNTLRDKHSTKVQFSTTDPQSVSLLKHIKQGFRSTFLKLLLRNALVQQNLCALSEWDDMSEVHQANFNLMPTSEYDNLLCADIFRDKEQTVTFLNRTVAKEYKAPSAKVEAKTKKDKVSLNDKPECEVSPQLDSPHQSPPFPSTPIPDPVSPVVAPPDAPEEAEPLSADEDKLLSIFDNI